MGERDEDDSVVARVFRAARVSKDFTVGDPEFWKGAASNSGAKTESKSEQKQPEPRN